MRHARIAVTGLFWWWRLTAAVDFVFVLFSSLGDHSGGFAFAALSAEYRTFYIVDAFVTQRDDVLPGGMCFGSVSGCTRYHSHYGHT